NLEAMPSRERERHRARSGLPTLREAPLAQEDRDQVDRGPRIAGIGLQRAPRVDLGPPRVAQEEVIETDVDEGSGEARIELDRAMEVPQGPPQIAAVVPQVAECAVALGEQRGPLEGPARLGLGPVQPGLRE